MPEQRWGEFSRISANPECEAEGLHAASLCIFMLSDAGTILVARPDEESFVSDVVFCVTSTGFIRMAFHG
jgi:hypothetical protein